MNRDKRDPEYPAELESQLILRLPEDPAKQLREVLKTGENLKNRLTIQIENDMRNGEVRFDHWLMHAKIVDIPTIVESMKTIDNKSFYKTADICQMMICKHEPEQAVVEEESPSKNKKKDPYKVDKKFLYPHGITPPTKNVRKRRFRKTLKKKSIEAPEIEKEVKRLLRTDNEAVSVHWEVVEEEDELNQKLDLTKTEIIKERKGKKDKRDITSKSKSANAGSSNVVDIFGGALSDSEEEDKINVELEGSHLSAYDTHLSETSSLYGSSSLQSKRDIFPTQFDSQMLRGSQGQAKAPRQSTSRSRPTSTVTGPSQKSGELSSEEEIDFDTRGMSKENMSFRMDQLKAELDELKQRRQRTQHEISGMENLALQQRFQDILHTLNQDIMYKEMEYQGIMVLQTSEDI